MGRVNFLKIISVLATLSVAIIPSMLNAQFSSGVGQGQVESLLFNIFPQSPGPNTDVSVGIQSFIYDLNSSNIKWSVNGGVVKEGVGEKSISFSTGNLGEVYNISVSARTSSGILFSKQTTIRPAIVDIIWETDGYVPPFYKGKRLYSPESKITVVAITNFIDSNGVAVSRDNAVYNWSNNKDPLVRFSGFGKKSLSVTGSLFENTETFSLTVNSSDGGFSAKGDIAIPAISPGIVFYENNPLYGILYNSAITGGVNMRGDEMTVLAVPYFFSGTSGNNFGLNFNWLMNGGEVRPTEASDQITLRREGGASGRANLSLTVRNKDKILQASTAQISISF